MPKKEVNKQKQGKLNRAAGARFELKVRKELEENGWIIDKWTNNVDLEGGKLIKARRKYNPYKKVLGIGTGFPDFIGFKRIGKKYNIMGIEVKRNGWLNKTEKEKCKWLLDSNIFPKILIARAVREKRRVNPKFIDFKKEVKNKL